MEIFDVVNEHGLPTGQTVERTKAHQEGICHRTAHTWVIRERNGTFQVLLQKRSANKDSFPGLYDTSAAGHITAGDEPLPSAVRELWEELGIAAREDELEFAGTFRVMVEKEFHGSLFKDNEFAFVFVYRCDIEPEQLVLQKEEVERADWFDLTYVYQVTLQNDPLFCIPMGDLKTMMDHLGAKTDR